MTNVLASVSFSGFRPSSNAASRSKQRTHRQNTKHEVILRKALWSIGLRYRKNVATMPGAPDIVLPLAKTVIFCDGDFWHGRNWRRLRARLLKRNNPEYWIAKIAYNRQRDVAVSRALRQLGWQVLRFWETDILKDPESCANEVFDFVTRQLDIKRSTSR
jgi:DNA mismatch endonuclease (patch repair protein)